METLKFKSNINCDGCIAKVTETLDKAVGHENWNVDIKNPDKVLTLIEENLDEEELKESLAKLGYTISLLKK